MAAYQFKPVWRNSNTRRDLSVEEMQLYVNHVFHPCVAVVVGPSIIVQRNRTSTEIIGAPTNAALAQREVLEARLMDAKASNNFAAVRQLTEELAALGGTLEKKRVLRVHQDTYKHVIWLNKVCFEYVAESDQEVNEVKFELDLKAEIKLSISLQAKVCDVTPEPEPVPAKAASSSSRPPVVALPRYPAPFSFPLVHMDLKPGVPYHILAASKLGMRLSKKGTTNAIMLSEVSAADTCQLVSFVPQDDNNWLILSWTKPEHALDVQSAKMTGDARLHFWSKVHRKPNQLFKIVKCPEGRAFIQVQHSSLWIKHQKDQIVQGNPINDDQAFHWTILPATAAGSQAVGSTGLFSRVSGASCV